MMPLADQIQKEQDPGPATTTHHTIQLLVRACLE